MNIDYKTVELFHQIRTAIYSDTATHKRLREVREYPYHNDKMVKALTTVVQRKASGINDTEAALLREFPVQGIFLKNYSNAMIFAPEMTRLPLKTHKAYVMLLREGYLGIVSGRIDNYPDPVEVLVRL